MEDNIARFLLRRIGLLFVACLSITALLSLFIVDLQLSKNRKPWFRSDDPVIRQFLEFRHTFDVGDLMIVAFKLPHRVAATDVGRLKTLTGSIEKLDNVTDVVSIATFFSAEEIRLFEKAEDSEFLRAIKKQADVTPAGEYLLSKDSKTVGILVNALYDDSADYEEIAAIKRTLESIERLQSEYSSRLGTPLLVGDVVIDDMVARTIASDIFRLLPGSFFISLVILLVLVRRVSLIVWPLLATACSLGCTLGLKAIIGSEFSVISSCIFAVVLILGTADSIHLIHAYHFYRSEYSEHEDGKSKAILRTLETTGVGCFLTSVTTALGFLSLTFSPIPIVYNLGISSAIGIMIAFVFTIVFCTFGFSRTSVSTSFQGHFVDRIVDALVTNNLNRPWLTVIVILSATITVSLFGTKGLEVESSPINYFRESSVVRRDFEYLEHAFGGLCVDEIIIRGRSGDFLQRENVERLGKTLAEIEGINSKSRCYPGTRVLKLFADAKLRTRRDIYDFVGRSKAPGLKRFRNYFATDFSATRISYFTHLEDNSQYREAVEIAKRNFPRLRVSNTGYGVMTEAATGRTVETLIRSFWISMIIISGMMMFVFGIRAGLISLISNFLPVLALQGIMVLMSRSLNIGTAIISAIALGIIVDDTIHFFWSFKVEKKLGRERHEAMARSLKKTGRAIIVTSLLFILGLNVLLFSSSSIMADFGLLSSIVIFLALVFDLTVAPILLVKYDAFSE